MNQDASTGNETPRTEDDSHPRLPCRGCTRDCTNYDRCDGKPWRMGAAAAGSL